MRHAKAKDVTDPVFALIERDQSRFKAVNEPDLSQEEMGARMDKFTASWWELVETAPSTIGGAIALAKYVADREEEQSRPSCRGPDWTDESGAAMALRHIASFLKSVRQ